MTWTRARASGDGSIGHVDAPPAIIWRSTSTAEGDQPSVAANLAERLGDLSAELTKTTFIQQHGASPMETARFVAIAGRDAVGVLRSLGSVDWDRESCVGSLSLGAFSVSTNELGTPWLAPARLHRRHARQLEVSVAVLSDGPGRCRIEVRPQFRRPWAVHRLRRCLQSTHAAADRLRELVLAPDFTPSSPTPPGSWPRPSPPSPAAPLAVASRPYGSRDIVHLQPSEWMAPDADATSP